MGGSKKSPKSWGGYAYAPTQVYTAYRHRASFRSVLTPIFGKTWARGGDRGIISALAKLREMWRARLLAYRGLGWAPTAAKGLAYMANCPPFGVETDDAGRCCRRPLVCPFCFAREYVLGPFRDAERHLFGSADTYDAAGRVRPPLVRGLHVLWFRFRPPVRRREEFTRLSVAGDFAPAVRRLIAERRRFEVDMAEPVFGAVAHLVQPNSVLQVVQYVRAGVLVVKAPGVPERMANYYARMKEGGAAWWAGTLPLTRKNLAEAFGRAIKYPRGMLTEPAWLALGLAEGLRRVRLISTYKRSLSLD